MKLHFCGVSWVCLSVWWYCFPSSYWQLKWCACCCCFLQGLVRSGDLAVQVLLVFLKLVLPLLILESMDLCPALESSPSAVPSHLCHHRKVRCQLAYCCSNKILSLSCKEEVLTSCNLHVIRNSDCCVPPWLFSIEYLTGVLASVKWRGKYLLASGEVSCVLVSVWNILLSSPEGFCKWKVFFFFFLPVWVEVRKIWANCLQSRILTGSGRAWNFTVSTEMQLSDYLIAWSRC